MLRKKPTVFPQLFASSRSRGGRSARPIATSPGISSALRPGVQLDVWSVVLAAGAGRRLSPLTGGIPKQYWQPHGRMSLLDGTLERLNPLIPARRTITIVDQSHRGYVNALANVERLGDIVYQPQDRGTAAGVLLGVLTVRAHVGDAIVVLTPSDHGVQRPEAFREGLRTAIHAARTGRAPVVLFGVEPDRAYRDYGWITAAPAAKPGDLARVGQFVEKPTEVEATRLLASGAVWNTMVLVARASALVERYRQQLPGLYAVLAPIAGLSDIQRRRYLATIYPTLPFFDFSHDLLTGGGDLWLSTWPSSLGWSDLGTPERMSAWNVENSRLAAHAASSAA